MGVICFFIYTRFGFAALRLSLSSSITNSPNFSLLCSFKKYNFTKEAMILVKKLKLELGAARRNIFNKDFNNKPKEKSAEIFVLKASTTIFRCRAPSHM